MTFENCSSFRFPKYGLESEIMKTKYNVPFNFLVLDIQIFHASLHADIEKQKIEN